MPIFDTLGLFAPFVRALVLTAAAVLWTLVLARAVGLRAFSKATAFDFAVTIATAVWILDFILAYGLGVFFQYFTIAPMRHLSLGEGVAAAIKADTASIAAWQVGMYGGMALIQFCWLVPRYGGLAPVNSAVFWFAMQLAMLAGFVTAFPINWLLIRIGWKEKM